MAQHDSGTVSTDSITVVTAPHIPYISSAFSPLTPVVPSLIPYAAGTYAFTDAAAAAAFNAAIAGIYAQLDAINVALGPLYRDIVSPS